MVNQEFYNLGTAPSVIRQLFAYGLEQAAKVGADKVYDYSLGNPSIPAPKKVNESIHKIVDETDSIKLHGYSMAPGFEDARAAVAKDLAARFGLDVKASELFFTCGAAPALISIIKALIVDGDSEIMAGPEDGGAGGDGRSPGGSPAGNRHRAGGGGAGGSSSARQHTDAGKDRRHGALCGI